VTAAASEIKACCAAAYSSPVVAWLLGPRLHPGGRELTERLIRSLGALPGGVVVDVACGRGESTLQVARATGAQAIGIDLSAVSIAAARRSAEVAGLAASVEFVVGDAEALPLGDGAADAVLCECSFCTFPDKERAAAELARVLKPGGRLALSDMVADRERLPASLRTLEAWVACLADARPLGSLVELLAGAGLDPLVVERHDDALVRLLERVDGRLRLARVAFDADGHLVERGLDLVAAARESIERGILGYAVVVARRTADGAAATMARTGASNLV
jgi:arsenite methyltransferase